MELDVFIGMYSKLKWRKVFNSCKNKTMVSLLIKFAFKKTTVSSRIRKFRGMTSFYVFLNPITRGWWIGVSYLLPHFVCGSGQIASTVKANWTQVDQQVGREGPW